MRKFTLHKIWGHIESKRQFQLLTAVLIMVVGSFIELIAVGSLLPFLGLLTNPELVYRYDMMQPIIHFFNINTPEELLTPMLLIFVILMISSGIFRVLLLTVQTRISHHIGADLSRKMYIETLSQPYLCHIKHNTADLVGTISIKSTELVYGIVLPSLIFFSGCIVLVMFIAAGLILEPILILSVITTVGTIYFLAVLITKRHLNNYSEIISKGTGLSLKNLHEGLGGIREVILNSNQDFIAREYSLIDRPVRLAKANTLVVASTPRYVLETLMIVLVAILSFLASNKSSEGFVEVIPLIGAFALAGQRLMPIASSIYTSWATVRGNREISIDILELLEGAQNKATPKAKLTPLTFYDRIDLDNISFRYPGENNFIINNTSMSIVKGTRIGIIGETGSGKSTFVNILMGLLESETGKISVDGVCITDENINNWRSIIAHVPQSIYLSDNSIAANIAFGVPENQIDLKQVEECAKQAQISDTIESWPDGYSTRVGERGVRLSGGQLQRIGIARALYKRAEIIIFDEATSALDSKTERDVMNALDNLESSLTVITIAHRLSTLKNCSELYEVKRGKLIKQRAPRLEFSAKAPS